jgi:glycosyltransferase involved in cell wall biosynthesis
MPCYNESEGLSIFIEEIQSAFKSYDFVLVVVNDSSTDDTLEKIRQMSVLYKNIEIVDNDKNLGHGLSTLKGLECSLNFEPELIMTLDGDGQFIGDEMRSALEVFVSSSNLVLEGVRVQRGDPVFRRFITFSLRLLVLIKSGRFPADANTPFSIYRRTYLDKLLASIPKHSLVPNVEISILTRKWRVARTEYPVTFRPRLGQSRSGTTWKSKRDWVPSKRFIRFCVKAIRQQF